MRKILLFLSGIIITGGLYGQYEIVSSSMGLGGLSSSIFTDDGTYLISQSIGQGSVIGTFDNRGYTLRQGFQQPFSPAIVTQEFEDNTLSANIYPNPFSTSVHVSFEEKLYTDLLVTLYETSGRIVRQEKFPPSPLLHLQLQEIPEGIYFLKITSGNKSFQANLIKYKP